MEPLPAIRVSQLRKSFLVTERGSGVDAALASLVPDGGKRSPPVDGISFVLQPGEIVGILGPPNGTGKTTTLKMRSGLLHLAKGGSFRVVRGSVYDVARQIRQGLGKSYQHPPNSSIFEFETSR